MENKLKKWFGEIKAPDMKEEIFMAIHDNKSTKPKLRLRAVVIAVAAAVMALGITAGAAVAGKVGLTEGLYRKFTDENGNSTEHGYHLDEGAAVMLSETALANIAPYVSAPGDKIYYEASTREEMEAFIDMPLVIPAEVEAAAECYRLMAFGTAENIATIYINIPCGEVCHGPYTVYLKVNAYDTITGGKTEFGEYALADGTPVTLALSNSSRSDSLRLIAYFKVDEALYRIVLSGWDKTELYERAHALLDTVQ
ncbi:MAG: hypothetical protein E7632_12180 [Ruminococcaceae bacterium]|nr:hypothetical protein [Oscillospiraceae bacterium]